MYARGYEAVSVADLCEAADARKGSFIIAIETRFGTGNDDEPGNATESVFELIFDTDDPVQRNSRIRQSASDGLTGSQGYHHVAGCRYGNYAVELSTRIQTMKWL